MRLRSIVLIGLLSLLGCRDTIATPPTESVIPPNRILILTIDTWRWDAIGVSGSGKVKTPNLDHLAAQGLYCPKAWSSATLTAPSHASLFTGMQPYRHGLRDNSGFTLAPAATTLAETLHAAGYATAAFVSAHPVARVSGLHQGFDVFDDVLDPANPLSVTPRSRAGAATVAAAVAWLKKAPAKCFVWVHLFEPHDPYEPPEPYRQTYRAAPYFGEVAYVDELVGHLRAAFEKNDPGNCLWVVCGDHGESLGDHGELTHGIFVYEATARVPLIVWSPGRVTPERLVSQPVRLVDVMPTVLALCGLTPPQGIDGETFLPSSVKRSSNFRIYVETLYPYLNFDASPVRALSDGRYKVIALPDAEAYDLESDPAESLNLEPKTGIPRVVSLLTTLEGIAVNAERPAEPSSDKEIRALQSLGYVGAGGDYRLASKGMDPKKFMPLYRSLIEANHLALARKWKDATALYLRLLASFPRSSLLLSRLGLTEMGGGDLAAAESHLTQALKLDPRNSQSLLGLANIANARNDITSAETYLLKVVAIDPDDLEGNFNLGALYYQVIPNPDKAITYWERFIKLQPNDPETPKISQIVSDLKRARTKPTPLGK